MGSGSQWKVPVCEGKDSALDPCDDLIELDVSDEGSDEGGVKSSTSISGVLLNKSSEEDISTCVGLKINR